MNSFDCASPPIRPSPSTSLALLFAFSLLKTTLNQNAKTTTIPMATAQTVMPFT